VTNQECRQEGYASKYNANDDDKLEENGADGKTGDPMQGLEGLDEAGPRQQ
jgi:hypothetical protein